MLISHVTPLAPRMPPRLQPSLQLHPSSPVPALYPCSRPRGRAGAPEDLLKSKKSPAPWPTCPGQLPTPTTPPPLQTPPRLTVSVPPFAWSLLRYVGAWVAAKKQGQGELYYANGDMFRGEWVQDRASGQGRLKYVRQQQSLRGPVARPSAFSADSPFAR
jgi:hypothetical protein